ncbi:transposase [Streptomyces sp. NRRL S-920]|uniref:transposase n=1 Tax=Streptomyces sp. NRRL S-920 TaxID=1463921 RepID=UPI000A846A2F
MPRGCSQTPADLAAGEEDLGLQQRLFGTAGCGYGKRLAVVLEECAEGLVGFAGAAAAVFGEGQLVMLVEANSATRYVQVMTDRRAYPNDLSDARWELIEPCWRFGATNHGRALGFGRPPEHDLREIMNAILYVDRPGFSGATAARPPPWETIYGCFAKWQKDGIFARFNGLLRELVRQQEGRIAKPSACVIDAQSVKTSTSAPSSSQGTDNPRRSWGGSGAS